MPLSRIRCLGRAPSPITATHLRAFPFPRMPCRITPKPRVYGCETAIVAGPKGDDDIHTDQFGRVKVQFHWDLGEEPSETSSCFIRVGTPWAGTGWGAIHIPRLDQEVIVAFLYG